MVIFEKMNESYYRNTYRDYCINELANQCVNNGYWLKNNAILNAEKEQDQILPNGVCTPLNSLYIIKCSLQSNEIGEIWFGPLPEDGNICFIFDLHIFEEYQQMNYGYESMVAAEMIIRKYKYKIIRLNVFNNNKKALKLYNRCGFSVINSTESNQWMEKIL